MKPHWIFGILLAVLFVVAIVGLNAGTFVFEEVPLYGNAPVSPGLEHTYDNVIIDFGLLWNEFEADSHAVEIIKNERVSKLTITESYIILEWPDGRARLLRNTPGVETVTGLQWHTASDNELGNTKGTSN